MIEKIVLQNGMELTMDEARELYQELRQLFEPKREWKRPPMAVPDDAEVDAVKKRLQRWDGAPIVTCDAATREKYRIEPAVVRPTEMWFDV